MKTKSKLVTGIILYSTEVRQDKIYKHNIGMPVTS